MNRKLLSGAIVVAIALSISAPARADTIEEWGYLTVRDGTRLRYHVIRPAEPAGGRFPVLLNYEGYDAGSKADDNGVNMYTEELMQRGYALLGVSVRGTACSAGAFDPFETAQARDGYDIVTWAATQPSWSDGRVGMIGVSFGGIMQLLTAQERPPHLRAIAPSSALADFYRDVAYPGGMLNANFPFAWSLLQKVPLAPPQADPECITNRASHTVRNTEHFLPTMLLASPYADDTFPNGESFHDRSPLHGFPKIEVPTLLLGTWQDEQLPSRWFEFIGAFPRQENLWVNVTNGYHSRDYDSPIARALTLDFLDRFVQDIPNGFEDRVPRLSVGMETKATFAMPLPENAPSWDVALPSGFQPTPRGFFLGDGARLTDAVPAGTSSEDDYAYPLPSPDVTELGQAASHSPPGRVAWKVPVAPGGALAYTTDPLEEDLVLLGPASLDLWLSSTATDTDLQVTVTEVRPDGMETYVQRGWLRASHRKLDPDLSTPTRPYHTHARADAEPLTPGEPTLVRVEVFPFAHAFRAGSRLRVWIDAPTGRTGLWGLVYHPEPAINTVHTGPAYPSKLVVGVIPGEVARSPLPACDTLMNQPCRLDPL